MTSGKGFIHVSRAVRQRDFSMPHLPRLVGFRALPPALSVLAPPSFSSGCGVLQVCNGWRGDGGGSCGGIADSCADALLGFLLSIL